MPKKNFPVRKKDLIIIAAVLSIFLYVAGVISGLYANKLIENQVNKELSSIKDTMDTSSLDIKNIMLQQLFLDNFDQNSCKFLGMYMDHLYSQISSYWAVLPARMEEYDKTTQQTDQYIALKREYIRLSLRYWLTATKNYDKCSNTDLIPILYFYTKECTDCVSQGENFDTLNAQMKEQNKTVLVFPIDADFEEDTVYLLKKFYNITEYPATVINGKFSQGQVLSADQLRDSILNRH